MEHSLQHLIRRYDGCGTVFDRVFISARARVLPLAEFDAIVPQEGTVVDVGCGHGILSMHLALSEPRRRVIGLDWAGPRIASAQQAARGISNLSFISGDLRTADLPPCRCVIVVGVLCLIPPADWLPFLIACHDRLESGGVLVLQEVELMGSWLDRVAALEQWALRVTGITSAEGYFTMPSDDIERILRNAGFQVSSRRIPIPGHPARVFEASKR